MARNGLLITFEGLEGSGKSTQIERSCEYLKDKEHDILFLREPGGVPLSEKIRDILLDVGNTDMTHECEMLLYMAARAQLVRQKIIPALDNGQTVICDRFLDSTLAYQGYGHDMNVELIKDLGEFVTEDVSPDLTIIFDIDPVKGLGRIKGAKDRIEQRDLDYHARVQEGYHDIARQNPQRVKVIESDRTIEEVFESVRQYIDDLLGNA
ncbi:MAG: dTMP kinase [Candidatus Omnitrophica bacterium]|nr:dTMP kinase [Candidatus Omnitrophota bacterium]MCB9719356.1 dTMP kinase [Candidatus Omnitrophota bacterium]